MIKNLILVVEDEESIQSNIKEFLEEDFQILLAESNQQRKLLFLENKDSIGAILMDGNLSDGDSLSLISKIINEYDFPPEKIISISGNDSIQREMRYIGCGVCPKPFSLYDILKAVQKAVTES